MTGQENFNMITPSQEVGKDIRWQTVRQATNAFIF